MTWRNHGPLSGLYYRVTDGETLFSVATRESADALVVHLNAAEKRDREQAQREFQLIEDVRQRAFIAGFNWAKGYPAALSAEACYEDYWLTKAATIFAENHPDKDKRP